MIDQQQEPHELMSGEHQCNDGIPNWDGYHKDDILKLNHPSNRSKKDGDNRGAK